MAEPVLREAVAGDAVAVAALVNEHAASLGLPPDQSPEHVAAWWTGDNVDALVAEAGGEVVGFGDLYVRGDHVRIDVGGHAAREALLDQLEARAAAHAAIARTVLHERDPAQRLWADRGYRSIRASYDMERDLGGELVEPSWPEGVTVRNAREGDQRTFWHVQEDSFADHWGYTRRSYEEWAHLYGTVRPFDPELWVVAEAGGDAVGVAIGEGGIEGDEDTGWIHVVGVLPAYRGRGLGLALLHWSFRALAGIGMRRAALSVDAENTTGAVRLYERAGMRVTQRFETWDRSL
jgi:ribosomal protein S18 acetylase RimI-like enzyme